MSHNTQTLVDGTIGPVIPVSPSVPTNIAEMLPVIREISLRKTSEGQSFQFLRNGRNVLDLVRRELKRRLNLDLSAKLPDEVNDMAAKAVAAFQSQLLSSMVEDGYQLTNIRKGIPFVKWDGAKPSGDGLRNTAVAMRDLRDDGERLVTYQAERRKCTARIATLEKNPAKYGDFREQVALNQAKVAECEAIIARICSVKP